MSEAGSMKSYRKRNVLLAGFALIIFAGALTSAPVCADDFGGTTTPNPPPWSPPDESCKIKCCQSGGGPPFSGPDNGDPILLVSGAERINFTDFTIDGLFQIDFTRRYDSSSTYDTPLGFGWSFEFDRRLFEYPDGSVVLRTGCGVRERFISSGGVYVTPRDGTQGVLTENPDGTYEFRYYDGTRDIYDADGRLIAEENREGQQHEFVYDVRGKLPLTGTSPYSVDPTQPMVVAYVPRLTRIQERSADGQLTGYAADLSYDENTGRLTQITADDGRVVNYTHDIAAGNLTRGNLTQVDGLSDLFYLYKYEDPADAHNITWIQYGQAGTPAKNTYDAQGRVAQQVQGATVLTFDYVTARTKTNVTRKIYDDQNTLLYTNVSTYFFDEAGYLTSEANALNQEMKSFYTANKDLEHVEWRPSVNGAAEKSTYYTFDGSGHKLTEKVTLDAADGGETVTRTWTYEQNWVSSEQAVSSADTSKVFRTEYTFLRDANNVPVAVASVKQRKDDGNFVTTTYSYCTSSDVAAPNSTCPYLRRLKSVDGPRTDVSDVTSYAYYSSTDESGCATPPNGACRRKGKLWKITNALGHVVEYTRYDKAGHVTQVKNANGVITDIEYDARSRVTARKVRGPDDSVETDDAITRFAYNDRGDTTRVTSPDGAYLDYAFDGQSRQTDLSDNLSNRIHYVLDSEGNRLRESAYPPGTPITGTPSRTSSQSFTKLNAVYQAKNAAGQAITYAYDVRGNAKSTVDRLNRSTTRSYDDLDRVTKTIQDASGLQATTKYAYDASNNLRQVTDPDNLATIYTYDSLSRLTSLSSPDTGTASYIFDDAGNRRTQTDARAVLNTYTYDALNRLTGIAYPTASLNVTYAYDQPNATTGCLDSYPVGRLTRMADASGSTTYCYDRRGNVTQKVQITGAVTSTTQYGYDLADRLATLTYPSGAIVTYGRNSAGQITSVTWKASATATVQRIVDKVQYYPFGPLNTLTWGSGRTLTTTYDLDYAIDSIKSSAATGLVLDLGVDAMGNIVKASGAINPATPERMYDYDALYRLTAAKTGATPPVPLENYTYNKTGDRLSASLNGGAAQTYTYLPGTHRLSSVGGINRSYDANGNTASNGVATFIYDDRNRLSTATQGATSAAYRINARSERVSKSLTTNGIGAAPLIFVYDENGQLLSAGSSAEFVYLDAVPIALTRSGSLSYIETDHLGTPRQVFDPATNQAMWTWDALAGPFGTAAPNTSPSGGMAYPMNLRFPGQYYDQEISINYNYFRDYEPTTGRYIEGDPMGLNGGINVFAYSESQPMMLTDRLGLDACGNCCDKVVWNNDPGSRTGGTPRCCGGVPTPCVNPAICTSSNGVQYPIDACMAVRACARLHELKHTSGQVVCSGVPEGGPADWAPSFANGLGECQAYQREVPCLAISTCTTSLCKKIIRITQEYKEMKRDGFCFRPR